MGVRPSHQVHQHRVETQLRSRRRPEPHGAGGAAALPHRTTPRGKRSDRWQRKEKKKEKEEMREWKRKGKGKKKKERRREREVGKDEKREGEEEEREAQSVRNDERR